jgi:SHS2 domain-containing protein
MTHGMADAPRPGVGRYRFVEDVAIADCAIDIEGRDLGDVFDTAAAALARLMVDPATVRRTVERTIVLEAPQLDLLLYDWLSELIFLKDRDGHVFTQTQAAVRGDGPCQLSARVAGGVIDPDVTELGADPKAVTFHQFVLERMPDGSWRARVVIDI